MRLVTNGGSGGIRPDAPARADDFGGHARVADAAVALVRSDPGGYAIALEGPWGSGKSTVVSMIRDRLHELGECSFIFDAWAHQGDPLRRSFLEALSRRLLEKEGGGSPWITPKLTEEVLALSGRSKTTQKDTTSRLRPSARAAAVGAILLPVGLVVLNYQAASWREGGVAFWGLFGAFLLIFAPIISGLSVVLVRKLRKVWRIADEKAKLRWYDVLAGTQTVTETSDVVEQRDPTSIEFEDLFGRLMTAALGKQSRRLVIVLDNLDRVEPPTALSVLATLQTFIGTSEAHAEEWRSRLWVVVPFDRDRFNDLWEDEELVGREQLEKLFLVTLRVPPLLLTDRNGYLGRLFAEAFPGEGPAEVQRAVAIHSLYESAGRSTPRRLKRLVNDVVALRLIDPEADLDLLTYFALLNADDGPTEDLVSGAVDPPAYVRGAFGRDFQAKLARVHFAREETEYRHELVRASVEEALVAGNKETFGELLGTHGIWDVVRALPYENWLVLGGEVLGTAVETMDSVVSSDEDRAQLEGAVEHIWLTIPEDQRLTVVTERSGLGYARMWAIRPPTGRTLADFFSSFGDDEAAPIEPTFDFSRLSGIKGFAHGLGGPSALTESTASASFEFSAGEFVRIAGWLWDNELPTTLVNCQYGPEELEGAAVQLFSDEPETALSALYALVVRFPSYAFAALSADAVLRLGPEAPPGHIAPSIRVLEVVPEGSGALNELVISGALHHHLARAFASGDDPRAAAELTLAILRSGLLLATPPSLGSASVGADGLVSMLRGESDEATMDELATLLTASDVSLLAKAVQTDPTLAGIRRVLTMTFEAANGPVVGVDRLVSDWEELAVAVEPVALATAARRESAAGRLEGASIAIPLNGGRASLAVLVMSENPSDPAAVDRWTADYVRTIDRDEWHQAFRREDDDRIRIIVARERLNFPTVSDSRFENELVDYCLEVARGTELPTGVVRQGVTSLVRALGNERQELALQNLGHRIGELPEVTYEWAVTFGSPLLEFETFRESTAFGVLIESIARSGPATLVDWLHLELSRYRETVLRMGADKLDSVRAIVAARSGSLDESDIETGDAMDRLFQFLDSLS